MLKGIYKFTIKYLAILLLFSTVTLFLNTTYAQATVSESNNEIVFIENNIVDYKTLIDGVKPGVEVCVLDSTKDGLAQMAEYLAGRSGVEAIHLITHGSEGALSLGSILLTNINMDAHAQQLATIGRALTTNGDILLYGCNVAKGVEGSAFIGKLAQLTGADIAASTDYAGAASLGGNWVLEACTGQIDYQICLTDIAISSFYGLLTTPIEGVTTFGMLDDYPVSHVNPEDPNSCIVNDIVNSGWDFGVYASSNVEDVVIAVDTITQQTQIAYGANFGAANINGISLSSNDGKLFDLEAVDIIIDGINSGNAGDVKLVGYLNGSAVTGATQTKTVHTAGDGGKLVNFDVASNTAFEGIDSFRVMPDIGYIINGAIGVDNVHAINFRSTNNKVTTASLSDDTGTYSTDFITKIAAQTISGTLSTILAPGESVQVSYNNGNNWADATTFTVGSTAWSTTTTLSVGSNTFKARVANSGGKGLTYSHTYELDTTAPTTTIASMSFSADTGASATDFITRTAAQTISGTLSANIAAGEIVEVSLDNGATWATATSTVGQNTWSLVGQTLTGSNTLKVRVTDAAGNSGTTASQAYVLDTAAPTTTIASMSFSADTGTSITDFFTKTAAQTVSGTLSANIAAGEIVEVSLNNGATWATAASIIGQNTWSLSGQTLTASNTLKVRVTDTAGNNGTIASQAYVFDTTGPAITFSALAFSADTGVSSSDFITSTAAQTITATLSGAPAGADIVYGSLNNGATWTDITSKVSGTTLTWNGVTLTGSNTLKLKVTDNAGNDGAIASQAYVLSTTTPTTTIAVISFSADTGTSATDFITNTAAQTISGTLSANLAAGEIVEVSLDNGDNWITATTVAGQNTWSLANQTLTASNTLKVRVSSLAGLSGTAASQVYVLDTAEPATTIASMSFSADTGSSATDFITRTAAQTVSGTLSANLAAGEIVEVSLDNDATWNTATAAVGQNTWSLSGRTLAASNTLIVRVANTAGNNGTSAIQAYVLDTAAPAITFSALAFSADTGVSSSDFITSTAAQTITATISGAPEVTDIIYGSLNNGATWTDITSKVAGTTLTWNGVTLTGSNTLKLKVTDNAGNDGAIASQAYVLSTTTPTTTIALMSFSADTGSSATDFITKTAAQTISGTLSANLAAGEIVEVSLNNGATWATAASTVGHNTWSLAGQTLTASNTLKVRVTSLAGLSGTAASQAYVLDTTAPNTTIASMSFSADTGTSASDFITKTAAQTISGTLSANIAAGEIVEVSLNNGATWATAASTVGQNTWSLAGQTLTASNTLKVHVTDTAGNSGTITNQDYLLDTTGPAITFSALAFSADTGVNSTDFITGTTAQTITATLSGAPAGTDIVCGSLNNGATWTDITNKVAGTTLTWNGVTLTGSNTLKLKVTDNAGNDGAPASRAYALDTTAPLLSTATVNGTQLILTYSEAGSGIDSGDTLQLAEFTVKVGGNSVILNTVSLNATNKTVTLTLSNAVNSTDTVTVSYVSDGNILHELQDIAGNLSVNLTNEAVVNNTAPIASNETNTTPTTTPVTPPYTEIIVNGQAQNAGTTTTATVGDQTVTTVTIDDKKIEEKLKTGDNNSTITIPINNNPDVAVGQLNGQTVKSMETKEAILEIKTENVTYTLPASEINIDQVSSQIGEKVELKDIKVSVSIAEPSADTVKIVKDTASKNSYQVVVKPVEFEITCTSGSKTVDVSKFNGYVERTVAIPDGVDPSKITTGIVLNKDGTFSHVPTTIIKIDGKYYAKINSLTNSTYSVIWSPKVFKDVENSWAKNDVNDMGSRLIIDGVGNGNFKPDREITRAEFTAIVVKALGLMRTGTGKYAFKDVAASAWYYDAVSIANEYKLVGGFGDGTFGPEKNITREEAMAIISRAMSIAKVDTNLSDADIKNQIDKFTDNKDIANWAKESAAVCVKNGIIAGNNNKIFVKKNITRAETAAIVRRMLQRAKLI